ncbi:MAG: sigma-70 family RNA polymerase sigma factor [Planctomycetes bacterium]|nr:sigma-70 family RNA polymerase sigma factor [Planctomycetota bacterium]
MDRASNPPDDREALRTTQFLVGRARAGDQDAFATLHRLHDGPVRASIARRMGCHLRDLQDVDDILQDTFLAAWMLIDQDGFRDFQTVGGFRNLLVKIALQKLQDAGRRGRAQRRARHRTEALPDGELPVASRQPRPSEDARARELAELREIALLRLTEQDRWVLDARQNLGMNWTEIAAEIGGRPANAKLRYFRARDRWNDIVKGRLGEAASGDQ